MKSVYEECPVINGDRFLIRLLKNKDAEDLLKVYSDEKAVPYFNGDNCNGDTFFFNTLDIMNAVVKAWLEEYENRGFVRFSIKNKNIDEVIGTIELFNRKADDYFNNCGMMRIDLRSDYETKETIKDILSIIVPPSYELFDCTRIITKARGFADDRIEALKEYGFTKSNENLIGNDGTKYSDYWIIRNN